MGSAMLFAILLFMHPWTPILADHPEVTLNLGVVRGSYMTTLNGRQFSAFRGIPYAKPPIGQLRFKRPQKLTEPLSPQPFDASKDGTPCSQYYTPSRKIIADEDCLILNVYTPQIVDNDTNPDKLAVIVHIHGGGFTYATGASTFYGPRRILDHDVILVTFNYRLSVLGFLSTLDDAAPGNYGLLDQVEVLKWVQENIHAFGGDSGKVTLLGESAGGACVGYHLLSNLSTDLFTAAIQMSGNPVNLWAYDHNPMSITQKYASRLGCNDTDSVTIIECLRNISATELLIQQRKLTMTYPVPFRPTLDGTFLTDSPLTLHQNNQITNRVPIMTGITEYEGLIFYVGNLNTRINNTKETITKSVMSFLGVTDIKILTKVKDLITGMYFESIDVSNMTQLHQKTIQLFSECLVGSAHELTLKSYLNLDLKPYVYSFDYVSDHSSPGFEDLSGATHGDDLFFLFDSEVYFKHKSRKLSDVNENRFLELWVNFANYRNPTPHDQKNFTMWPASELEDLQIYHLNDPITVRKSEINLQLIDFWFKKIPDALVTTNDLDEDM